MKTFTLSAIALIFLLNGAIAKAATQWCYFNIDYIWASANGAVFVLPKERGDHIQICNLNQPHHDISTTVCKAWFQTVTVASVTKKRVIIQYADTPSCAALPHYGNAPPPTYIMLENP